MFLIASTMSTITYFINVLGKKSGKFRPVDTHLCEKSFFDNFWPREKLGRQVSGCVLALVVKGEIPLDHAQDPLHDLLLESGEMKWYQD